jgi:hypothetical protein
MGIFSCSSQGRRTDKKPSAPDYETLLSRLSSDISDAKIHLSEIRLRERRSALLITLYGLGLWALWAGLWWVGGLPFGLLGWDREGMEVKIVGAAGVGIGPILYVHLLMGGADGSIYALNRLLGLYFNRQRNAEGMLPLWIELMIEHHLRKLLAEHSKINRALR